MYKGWLDAGGSSVSDAVDGGKQFKTGFRGAAKGLPSAFGVPSTTYRPGDSAGPDSQSEFRIPQSAIAPPVPETPDTLAAQMNALLAGRRSVVEVTPDAMNDPDSKVVVPAGFRSFKTFEGGRIIYDPRRVTREEVVRRMDGGSLGALD